MASEEQTYYRLIDEYIEKLGEGPPTFHFGSDAEGIELMRRAIERGSPIKSDEIPLPREGEDF